eukprot:408370-Pyramimonas_sp.AAC.1
MRQHTGETGSQFKSRSTAGVAAIGPRATCHRCCVRAHFFLFQTCVTRTLCLWGARFQIEANELNCPCRRLNWGHL